MSELSDRLKKLSPEQQKLLEMRLKQRARQKEEKPAGTDPGRKVKKGRIDFSIFFFSAEGKGTGSDKYKLLMESAKFADQGPFKAVWTPERHFQAFGGLYPNPSVISAALALHTQNLRIRAGSVVAPLHSPVRIAEEWALVDNLSNGRVDIAFATGWHRHDYVIRPENFATRRDLMFTYLETVRALWRGEEVTIAGVDGDPTKVRTLPRPVQAELPCWVTATSERTWREAGRLGANVLTMMVGRREDITANIRAYREARTENGHDPRTGIVTMMLHTYLDPDLDRARDRTRVYLHDYLRNFLDQFKAMNADRGAALTDPQKLLDFAFERYFNNDGLLGPPDKCLKLLRELEVMGVNEAACLLDFGVPFDASMESLERVVDLEKAYRKTAEENTQPTAVG